MALRLALVVPSLDQGGGVQAVARFVKDAALRSGRYEPKLISLCMSSRDSTSLQITTPVTWLRGSSSRIGEWDGLPYTHVGANFGEFEFQRYKPRKVLTRLLSDCDVVQVVCGCAAWANTVTGLGKPVALQVATRAVVERRRRDAETTGLNGAWWRAMTIVTNRYDDKALQSVDAIQVENPWMLDYASRINTNRKVDLRFVPPGVNTQFFKPSGARVWQQDPYIICVGRLSDPRKNIGLLLEAYSILLLSIQTRARLVLVGASGPGEKFWQRAEVLNIRDRIIFHHLPSQDDLLVLYQKAAVFALPSDEEGLGVVILEAMSCGIPVVSTKSGGPDGIINSDVDGYLTPLDDAATMANRLEMLLTDVALNQRMGLAARAKAVRRYDEVITGNEFVNTWDRLIEMESLGYW